MTSASQARRLLVAPALGAFHAPCACAASIRIGLPFLQIRHGSIEVRKRILDRKIPFDKVRVRDETTRILGPLTSLSSVMSSINKEKERIELILSNPEPVVRIISKDELKELYRQDKAHAKARLVHQAPPKQIQMTWGIGREDLDRKLEKARQEMGRGTPVDIVLGKKKRMPPLTREEKKAKMDEIATALKEHGKEDAESRSMGSQLSVMHFRPTVVKAKPLVPTEGDGSNNL